jgi:GNAT superfamily N-acetyltransferase
MIHLCDPQEFGTVWAVINDGARAYTGVIQSASLRDPYMKKHELEHEIEEGVVFWACELSSEVVGVMGIQELDEVTLIRHAYVRTSAQGRGIGGQLLSHLRRLAKNPLLIGTWAEAKRAIAFYEKHRFAVVSEALKDQLLRQYWKISERQIETSVVLASPEWYRSLGLRRSGRLPSTKSTGLQF